MLSRLGATWRIAALALLAAAIWGLAKHDYRRPAVLGLNGPATSFSAGRADATLKRVLGPEIPHPSNSVESAAVRNRILAEFQALGVKAATYRAFTCNPTIDPSNIPCRTVTDILAEVIPGSGKAVVLMAHYDSVPAGPGASDDAAGVAAVLEAARALRARSGPDLHPVLALITDGEEAGLLGAKAFLENPALLDRVGAVVNLEARGSRGRSILFQTSAGGGPLIDLYARNAPAFTATSLAAEIYRFTPNDTDLSLFVRRGIPSVNLAFVDNSNVYHTPLDSRANLDPVALQTQGETALDMAAALERTPFARLKGGDEVYLDLFGFALPRAPEAWAAPTAVMALLLLLIGAWRARDRATRPRPWALAAAPALLVLSVLAGFALHLVAQRISGFANPSHAYPDAFRLALALGILTAAVLCARMVKTSAAAFGVWLWFALLGLATAVLLPGVSPYFLLPVLPVALTAPFRSAPVRTAGLIAGALVATTAWLSLAVLLEAFRGLALHPVFTVPAAFAAMTLIPLLGVASLPRAIWIGVTSACGAGAVACAVVAGLQPAYSPAAPKRINLVYVEDADAGRAWWAASTAAPLPASLRRAAAFSPQPVLDLPGRYDRAYLAPAGAPRLTPPRAEIVADIAGATGRTLVVDLHGSPGAWAMFVMVPKAARVSAIELNGQHLAIRPGRADTTLACLSLDCAEERLTLRVAARGPFRLRFSANTYGLLPEGAALAAARPRDAVASQDGDGVVQLGSLRIPAAR